MPLNPVNPTIRRWLDQGHAKEVLLGQGEYFVSDHDYSDEHDRILVGNQLVTWAVPDHAREAGDAVNAAVKQLVAEGDVEATLDLILSFVLVSEDRKLVLDVDRTLLGRALDRADSARVTGRPREHIQMIRRRLAALPPATVT